MLLRDRLVPLAVLALLVAGGCNGSGGSSKTTASSAPASTVPTPPAPITSNNPPAPVTTATKPGSGPVVISATWTDVNGNGAVDAGDQVVVQFSREVVVTGASAGDFFLPVSGDRLGMAASVTSSSNPTNVVITLGKGVVLTIPGTFNPSLAAKPGSPSGIDLASAAASIADAHGVRATASQPVDIASGSAPPPGALTLTGCDFADVNSSGTVDLGDTLTLHFSGPVVLGTGSNQPKPTDFTLPVTGDAFGVSAYVQAGAKASDVVIFLGASPTITLGGTFDPTKTTAGSYSGIAPGATLTAAKLASQVGNLAVATSTGVNIAGVLGAPAGPKLTYVNFVDSNQNGRVDEGDILVLGFSVQLIDMATGSNAPQISDILLPVAGDVIDPSSTWDYGTGLNEINVTIHGTGTILTVNGTFDPTKTTAGSASGLGFASSLQKGAITDGNSNADIQTGPATVTDITGTLVPATPPVVVSAVWVDRDLDGKASQGDTIVIEFNEPVMVDTTVASPSDFQLPVSGDSFGQGATVTGGPNPAEVTITLGASPVITTKGSYDKSMLSSGSPSGIDVAANPTPGSVRNVRMITMAAATIAWDVQEPLGALDNPMSNDAVKDASATTASWNVGKSGRIVASASFDVGAGTTALSIASDTTIDTSLGQIGGVASPAFKGSGVFEFTTIDIATGVNVTVTGTNPLVLKATGAANVNGIFLMDGTKGGDNLVSFGGSQGIGGAGGPGGYNGGNGAAGGGINIFPGQNGFGALAGQGGGTEAAAAGGGGAGFANAGGNGTDSGVSPGGLGGAGGAQASAAGLRLDPFQGGSGGGGGGALQQPSPGNPTPFGGASTAPGAGGGGGGGAFRLAAGGAINFGGTVSVKGGDGGSGGGSIGGAGAGAGAGGAILIQSVSDVTLAPSATFLATGGKGGQGTAGGNGSDGVILVEANGKLSQLTAAITGSVRPDASEGVVNPGLATGTSTLDLAIAASSVIDTDKGELNGTPVAGFAGNGVFACRNFSVAAGATLAVVGNTPLTIQANGKVDVSGTIDLSGASGQASLGLNGGLGGRGRAGGMSGGAGGSLTLSSGSTVASEIQPSNGSGAGAGTAAVNGSNGGGGGGAAFGTPGADGMGYGTPGTGGSVYGTPDLASLAGGSGGGGGSANDAQGSFMGGGGAGAGGGALEIDAASDVSVSGAITADGGNGGVSANGGNGGAGAGGAVAIRSLGRISVAGTITALGGDGGKDGGPAGNGRVRLEDTVGSFLGGTVSPALTTGKFGTSVATSQWIRLMAGAARATGARPLAILASGTSSGGAFYAVEVETANDTAGAADPTTATGFQTDARALAGKEWARFRVTLDLGASGTGTASVDRVYVPFK
jgi:hypothetical protein